LATEELMGLKKANKYFQNTKKYKLQNNTKMSIGYRYIVIGMWLLITESLLESNSQKLLLLLVERQN